MGLAAQATCKRRHRAFLDGFKEFARTADVADMLNLRAQRVVGLRVGHSIFVAGAENDAVNSGKPSHVATRADIDPCVADLDHIGVGQEVDLLLRKPVLIVHAIGVHGLLENPGAGHDDDRLPLLGQKVGNLDTDKTAADHHRALSRLVDAGENLPAGQYMRPLGACGRSAAPSGRRSP